MSNINAIAHSYKGKEDYLYLAEGSDTAKSFILEEELLGICESLSKIEGITGNKNIDIDYLLGIVGSYLLGLQEGSITKDETEPPSKLFEVSLFPALKNIDNNITKETEYDGGEDTRDSEELDTE